MLYVRDDGISSGIREREGDLRLEMSCGFGFPKSRCIYTKGMGCRLEDGGYALRGSLEVSRDAPGGVVGVGARDCRSYCSVWVELSFSS